MLDNGEKIIKRRGGDYIYMCEYRREGKKILFKPKNNIYSYF